MHILVFYHAVCLLLFDLGQWRLQPASGNIAAGAYRYSDGRLTVTPSKDGTGQRDTGMRFILAGTG
jgi:hypothetical protein